MSCAASGKTAVNMTCKLKPIAANLSLFNISADFLRPTRGIFVSEH